METEKEFCSWLKSHETRFMSKFQEIGDKNSLIPSFLINGRLINEFKGAGFCHFSTAAIETGIAKVFGPPLLAYAVKLQTPLYCYSHHILRVPTRGGVDISVDATYPQIKPQLKLRMYIFRSSHEEKVYPKGRILKNYYPGDISTNVLGDIMGGKYRGLTNADFFELVDTLL